MLAPSRVTVWSPVHVARSVLVATCHHMAAQLLSPAQPAWRPCGCSVDGAEHCVCEMMSALGATQSRMSRHMQVLKQAGLVTDRRDAQWVRYRRNPDLAPAIATLLDAALSAEATPERSAA